MVTVYIEEAKCVCLSIDTWRNYKRGYILLLLIASWLSLFAPITATKKKRRKIRFPLASSIDRKLNWEPFNLLSLSSFDFYLILRWYVYMMNVSEIDWAKRMMLLLLDRHVRRWIIIIKDNVDVLVAWSSIIYKEDIFPH